MALNIKLHATASKLAASDARATVLIAGYPVARHEGVVEVAPILGGPDMMQIAEKDIAHHIDGEDGPSTFYVASDAQITMIVRRDAASITKAASACNCDNSDDGSSEAIPETLMRRKGRADAIRSATCLGEYMGCMIGCIGAPYPDMCMSICSNRYNRCTTPILA